MRQQGNPYCPFAILVYIKVKGAPAGTPLVAGLAGFCNSITEHIINENSLLSRFSRKTYSVVIYRIKTI